MGSAYEMDKFAGYIPCWINAALNEGWGQKKTSKLLVF